MKQTQLYDYFDFGILDKSSVSESNGILTANYLLGDKITYAVEWDDKCIITGFDDDGFGFMNFRQKYFKKTCSFIAAGRSIIQG